MIEERCKTCRFYSDAVTYVEVDTSWDCQITTHKVCRQGPPVNDKGIANWPRVHPLDWCGYWEERGEEDENSTSHGE